MHDIKIVEVGPRDGLQNESQTVSTADKIKLITLLEEAGLSTIEAGSFVSPKWVPQMADTKEVLAGLSGRASYPVLVPNQRGLEAAKTAGATHIALFASATESFSQKNINCTREESLSRFAGLAKEAEALGMQVRGYLSCVLGCPYEGAVEQAEVVRMAQALYDLGVYEVSLGDTIGVGTPDKARALCEAIAKHIPVNQLALHFHDTYGQALANIYACLPVGIRTIDSAIAGLGGCPYAQGASGNVATEDVLYLLDGLGYNTGINFERLLMATQQICQVLNQAPRAKTACAMLAKTGV